MDFRTFIGTLYKDRDYSINTNPTSCLRMGNTDAPGAAPQRLTPPPDRRTVPQCQYS